jgi:hypothetical protein
VRGKREKKNKTDILRVRTKLTKKETFIKKTNRFCERRLFHLSQKIIFFGVCKIGIDFLRLGFPKRKSSKSAHYSIILCKFRLL